MEVWKDINGYEKLYQISSAGVVKSKDRYIIDKNGNTIFKRGRILKGVKDRDGYYYVSLYKNGKRRGWYIHRLVALHFVKGDTTLVVNHKDGKKENNSASNLEWVTQAQNILHAYEKGLNKKIEKNHPTLSKKVRCYDVNGNFIKEYPSLKEAERQTGIWQAQISRCARLGKCLSGFYWKF
ncbi:TPA: HNH endonuclease [Streptococcus suis]|nr:HNH endonuclease [Streptococcus suis]HEL1606029.1 HNH endonuclease [Streptococcus suis]HEM2728292.1 HNH endonuclease [Streptococcus suis]